MGCRHYYYNSPRHPVTPSETQTYSTKIVLLLLALGPFTLGITWMMLFMPHEQY